MHTAWDHFYRWETSLRSRAYVTRTACSGMLYTYADTMRELCQLHQDEASSAISSLGETLAGGFVVSATHAYPIQF